MQRIGSDIFTQLGKYMFAGTGFWEILQFRQVCKAWNVACLQWLQFLDSIIVTDSTHFLKIWNYVRGLKACGYCDVDWNTLPPNPHIARLCFYETYDLNIAKQFPNVKTLEVQHSIAIPAHVINLRIYLTAFLYDHNDLRKLENLHIFLEDNRLPDFLSFRRLESLKTCTLECRNDLFWLFLARISKWEFPMQLSEVRIKLPTNDRVYQIEHSLPLRKKIKC